MRFSILLIATLLLLTTNSFGQITRSQTIEDAAKWRFDQLKDEQGNFYAGYAAKALQQADGYKSISRSGGLGLEWQELGPNNVGGAMTALLIDKRDSTNNTLYAGSFNGGVWKSTDGAANWQRLTGWNQWLAISCIEQAPAPDYTIYIGTGDGFSQPDGSSYNAGSYGNGIFKLDANDNPVLLTPTIFTNNLYDPPASAPWAYVNAIAINQSNSTQIMAATASGLYQSNDAGTTWVKVTFAGNLVPHSNEPMEAIKWSGDGNNIFIACGYYTSTNSVLYSNNGGVNWSLENSASNSGFPTGSFGRTSLAIAPSNPNVVYALMATTSSCTKGLYQSGDAGRSWTTIATGGDTAFSIFSLGGGLECQGWYDNVTAVSPADTGKFYLGGVELYTGSDASGLNAASESTIGSPNPYYIAPDIKSITIADNNSDLMYVCSDGGVFKSTNALSAFPTPTYTPVNRGLSVALNYGIGVGIQGDVIGGTQTNGTYYIDFQGNNAGVANVVIPGDGIVNAVSQIDTNAWFGGYYFGALLRSIDHANTFSSFFDGKIDPSNQGAPSVCGGNSPEADAQFITPFYLGETKNAVDGVIKVPFVATQNYTSGQTIQLQSETANYPFSFILSQNLNNGDSLLVNDPIRSRLFMSTECGVFLTSEVLNTASTPKWFGLATGLQGMAESFVTTTDGNGLFIGTDNGVVYRCENLNIHADTVVYRGGGIVSTLYAINDTDISYVTIASGRSIEGIDVDPNDNNHIVAVVAGFSSVVREPHVYESHDGGVTWVGDTAGLPNMPVYSVVIHDANTIIIGTEFGIWTWDGSSWHEDNGNFERVPVYRMIERPLYQDGCNVLYVGTSGRGMWRCTTLTPASCNTAITTAVTNVNESEHNKLRVFPNPTSNQFKVAVELERSSSLTLRVFDLSGRLYSERDFGNTVAGTNLFNYGAVEMSSGTYVLSAILPDGQTLRQLFVIAK
jgi:hypothetical protein